MTSHKCMRCGRDAIVDLGGRGEEWVCSWCLHEIVNSPRAMQMTEADMELTEHLDGGGQLN
jgi:DNA-directed RNA polymerase subunit RPC12/RpoP